MPLDYEQLLPLILAGCVPYLALSLLGRWSPAGRACCAVICVIFSLRYIWWRWNYSLPVDQQAWQQAWAWFFLVCETMSNFSSVMVYTFMSRTRSRSTVVDARS